MKAAIACGGTGGHLAPGLVTAEVLAGRGHAVGLWIAGRRGEQDLVRDWPGSVHRVPAAGFPASFSPRSVSAAARLVRAFGVCRREMKQDRPDVVLAMGSYASVGPALAARTLGVPVVLHEANAVPGRAVSFLAPFAAAVAFSFAGTVRPLRGARSVLTGFPVRRDLGGQFEPGAFDESVFTVLVMGGSQGAHTLNRVGTEAICRLRAEGGEVQVVHLAGHRDAEWVRERYASHAVRHRVFSFLREIGKAYRAAHLAVARAGAATCAELQACAVPALLVPLPGAVRDHQAANARILAGLGGADVVREEELSPERLQAYLDGCRAAPAKLAGMRDALRAATVADGAGRLADLVEQTARTPRAARSHGAAPASTPEVT